MGGKKREPIAIIPGQKVYSCLINSQLLACVQWNQESLLCFTYNLHGGIQSIPRAQNAGRLFVRLRAVWCLEVQHSRCSKAQLHLPQLQPWPDPTSGSLWAAATEGSDTSSSLPNTLCESHQTWLFSWTRTDLVSLIVICVVLIVMPSSGMVDP